jgi:hypothetical protein
MCYKETRVVKAFDKAIENILRDTLGTEKVDRYFAHMILRKEPIFRKERKGVWRKAEAISLTHKLLYIISIVMWIGLLLLYMYPKNISDLN